MAVKTITAEVDGQIRRITADIPDDATPEELEGAVREHLKTTAAAPKLGSEGNAELARFGLSAEPPKAPKPPDEPASSRFIGGVRSTTTGALPAIGRTLVEANKLLHPANAAMTGQAPDPRRIVEPNIEMARQAKKEVGAGNLTSAAAYGAAAVTPWGPIVADIGNTVRSGDVAGAAGKVTGIGATVAAARYAPPIVRGAGRAVATAADRMGVPAALERSALNSYRRMLNPSAKGVVPEAERVAEGLVKDRPVAMTRGGMIEQMQSKKAEVGPAAGTIYDNRPPVDPTPILQQLDGMRQRSSVAGGVTVDQGLSDAITGIADNIRAMRDSNGMVPAKALDQYRDLLFKGNVSATNHMRATAPASAASLEKGAANVIRTRLDELFPDAKPINDAYHTAASTENFLREATNAEKAAESGIRTGAASGFGAAVKKVIPAPLRGVPTAAASIFESTGWDSSMGAGKAMLADAIRKAAWKRPPNAQTNPARLLPPGSAPFTQGTIVPDILGRPDLRRGYNAGLLPPAASPDAANSFTRPAIITPPPADTSFVRGVSAMPSPLNPRRALPAPTPKMPAADPSGITVTSGAPIKDVLNTRARTRYMLPWDQLNEAQRSALINEYLTGQRPSSPGRAIASTPPNEP